MIAAARLSTMVGKRVLVRRVSNAQISNAKQSSLWSSFLSDAQTHFSTHKTAYGVAGTLITSCAAAAWVVLDYKIEGHEQVLIEKIDKTNSVMTSNFQTVDEKFDKMDKVMTAKFETVDQKFDKMDKVITAKFDKVDAVMTAKFETVDQKFNKMDEVMTAKFDKMDAVMNEKFESMDMKLHLLSADLVKIITDKLAPISARLERVEEMLQNKKE
jgi:ATP-dependent Lon protease